jgi:hypothetical protein
MLTPPLARAYEQFGLFWQSDTAVFWSVAWAEVGIAINPMARITLDNMYLSIRFIL